MYQFKYAYQVGWVWGDIYDGIKRLAKLGYQGVEVAGQPEYFSQAQQIGRACREEGVVPSSICSILDQFDIAHPDKNQRQLGNRPCEAYGGIRGWNGLSYCHFNSNPLRKVRTSYQH